MESLSLTLLDRKETTKLYLVEYCVIAVHERQESVDSIVKSFCGASIESCGKIVRA